MDDPPPQLPEPLPADSNPTGFKTLSEKLKRRTTDLVAVAILAVGCIAVGAKLGRWWKQSPGDLAVPANSVPQFTRWGEAGNGVSFEFGDLNYAIHHRIISGDASSAAKQLERIAIAQLANAAWPATPPAPAERKLLAELQKVSASRTLSTGESLYRIGSDLPMLILTKPLPADSLSKQTADNRVVCWARAFPQAEDQWMVFLFSPVKGTHSVKAASQAIPLPPGCRRIQSLRDAGGQSCVGFRGPGPLLNWQRHFGNWFRNRDWQPIHAWSKTESAWTATFESSPAERRAEIWLHRQANGAWEGMVYTARVSNRGGEQ